MSDSLRQLLFNAVKVRFEAIRTANGYATELGSHFWPWRDLEKSPFEQSELPGFTMRDTRCVTSTPIISHHSHELTIEVLAASMGASPDNWARMMAADLHRAIGIDRRWTVDGTELATDTLPGEDTIVVGHYGERIGAVMKTFTIRFRTAAYNPYA